MSFDYSDIVSAATEALAEFGQVATLTRTTGSGTSSSQTGSALRKKLNEGDRRRLGGPAGDMSIDSSKWLVSAAVAPLKGDRLTVGSVVVGQVEFADPLAPGASTVLWTVLAVSG